MTAALSPLPGVRSAGSRPRGKWLGLGLATLAGVSFGLQGVLAKFAYAGGANVPTTLALRFGAATLVIWGLVLATARGGSAPSPPQSRRKALGFALLGVLFVAGSLFYFLSLQRLPVSVTALLVYIFPALTVLWGRLFFGERLDRRKVGALALALFGCVLTIDPRAAFTTGARIGGLGIALAFGSALSNSWYATLAAPIGRGVPGLTVAARTLPVTAGGCFIGWTLVTGSFTGGMTAQGWLVSLLIGVLTGLAVWAYLVGVGMVGASRAAITVTSEPVVSVLLGASLLAEPIGAPMLLGGACIVAAIVLLSRSGEDGGSTHGAREGGEAA